ncbi:MAG: ATP-dependent helicase HrpB, partial [Beijerinckiaceae bacterium]|nr:ATP-dependent helicase HrpB [Beijerinckiaceae bacterium]
AAVAGDDIVESVTVDFDVQRAALRARRTRRLGALVLAEATLPVPPGEASAIALAAGLATLGLDRLPWTPPQRQLRNRVALVRRSAPDAWPDLSDDALAADGAAWLVPFLDGATSLAAIDAGRLDAALAALLPWDKARRLDEIAPAAFTTPAGAQHRLDYAAEQGPTLSVRVQELYGLAAHPTVAGVPLVLELLSPAGRPIQVTRDLPGFWAGSWRDVRTEMRGRYPKHVWPDDPAAAVPTLRAKPRARPGS